MSLNAEELKSRAQPLTNTDLEIKQGNVNEVALTKLYSPGWLMVQWISPWEKDLSNITIIYVLRINHLTFKWLSII